MIKCGYHGSLPIQIWLFSFIPPGLKIFIFNFASLSIPGELLLLSLHSSERYEVSSSGTKIYDRQASFFGATLATNNYKIAFRDDFQPVLRSLGTLMFVSLTR